MKSSEHPAALKAFPYQSSLSFVPLIQYWETKINDDNRGISLFAKAITKQLERSPELLQPIPDLGILTRHEDLLELLMTAIFPAATWETDISGALIPFLNTSFYQTPKFAEIFVNDDGQLKRPLNLDQQAMLQFYTRQAFLFILNKV